MGMICAPTPIQFVITGLDEFDEISDVCLLCERCGNRCVYVPARCYRSILQTADDLNARRAPGEIAAGKRYSVLFLCAHCGDGDADGSYEWFYAMRGGVWTRPQKGDWRPI